MRGGPSSPSGTRGSRASATSVQRCPMFSPLRLTIASTPRAWTRRARRRRIPADLVGRSPRAGPGATPRGRPRRAGTSADPISPDAPLTTTFTRATLAAVRTGVSKVANDAEPTAPPRRDARRAPARAEPDPLRPLVRRARGRHRVRRRRGGRHVGDDVRRRGAVRVGLGARCGRNGRCGGPRRRVPQRALRRDQRDRRLDLPRRQARRLVESQAIVDESWALSGRRGRFEWPILVGSGLVFYVLWVGSTALGTVDRRRARRSRTRSASTRRSRRCSSRSPCRTCASGAHARRPRWPAVITLVLIPFAPGRRADHRRVGRLPAGAPAMSDAWIVVAIVGSRRSRSRRPGRC